MAGSALQSARDRNGGAADRTGIGQDWRCTVGDWRYFLPLEDLPLEHLRLTGLFSYVTLQNMVNSISRGRTVTKC